MEITPNGLSGLTPNIQATDSAAKTTLQDDAAVAATENTLYDQVDLSDASRMLSAAMKMAEEGNTEVQPFLSTLEDGLKTGNLDMETLMKEAPKELVSKMESMGIDTEETLQTISDFVASMPSPPPPAEETVSTATTTPDVQETKTATEQTAPSEETAEAATEEEAAAQGAGGGGAVAGSSSSGDDTIEEQIDALQEQIKQVQQEIAELKGKEQTETVQTQIATKQAELSELQAELTILQSELSESKS